MLGLKLPTDPRWVNIVESNLEEILTDHAWCEQKAASNAISIIVKFSDFSEMIEDLTEIAQEEIEHFRLVCDKIRAKGFKLGPERKDPYVHDLMAFFQHGGSRIDRLIDKLLLAAMIEARSCERFRILSLELQDPDLKIFYHELMISEANHYTTFLGFARKYGDKNVVNQKWEQFLDYEANLMKKYGIKETMHG